MLEKFSFYIIPSLTMFAGFLYIQSKILNQKVNFKDIKFYMVLIIYVIFNIFVRLYIDGFLRMIVNTILIIFVSYLIFKKDTNSIFGAVILEQVIYFFSELLNAVVLLLLGVNQESISNNIISFSLLNVFIVVVAIILYHFPIVKYLVNKSMNLFSRISNITKYILVFILFITLSILMAQIYFNSDNKHLIVINAIFIIVYSIIIYNLFNEKSENVKFKQENKMLLDSLNDYEKMLDYQRVNNHENKNQLLVIKSMISKNNKKALDYLDEIIDEKRKDDEGLYTYAKIIPEGGLQGLIYQKMLKMKENNIKINLDVDNKLRKVSFDNISSKTNYDLCRVVGIILDNAIEEVMNLKDKEILVYMHKEDNYFVIEVSNKCKNIPDLSKLDEKGYTTKSNGHGYGLSLLKDIVSKNNLIVNERSINKDIFTQIIKIKM